MTPIRICSECRSHAAIRDGSLCRDCANDYLRATRPQSIREPRWLTWTREHGNAKDLTRSAA